MHSSPSEAPPGPSAITSFLFQPASPVSLPDLALNLAHARITVIIPGAAALAARPEIPGRVRGALGDVLRRTASDQAIAGHPCHWDPPSALDLLFRSQGKMTSGLDIPKPFVLALDPDGPDLRIACILFGLAAEWSGQIGDALVLALREGIRHPDGGRLTVTDRTTHFHSGVNWDATRLPLRFSITFLTPFSVTLDTRRHDPDDLSNPDYVRDALPRAALRTIGNRLTGIARWAGLDLQADWAGIAAEVDALKIETNTIHAQPITRSSRRQKRVYKVNASTGRIVMRGDVDLAAPGLVLGQIVHAGAKTSQGMGRYRIEVDL